MLKQKLIDSLCDASIKREISPYEKMPWPDELDSQAWYFSPELVSLYGLEEFDSLEGQQQKRLAFFEAVNFFSLNIHGEKPLIQGLASRLYNEETQDVSSYLHHFLDEENDHMVYFGGFCQRYAGKVYRDRKLEFPRKYEKGEEDFLFFLKVLIFEEIVDLFNQKMATDERLAEISREINRRHHIDEARHLAFGRNYTKEIWMKYSPGWTDETISQLREYIPNYLIATWKEYHNPEVYEDAGLDNSYELVEKSFESEKARERRKEISAGCIRYLLENEILLAEPAL